MKDRYQRHNLIDWFDQLKLHESKVVVVGAGAVGNEVLKNLVLLGVGSVSIYDYDIIEEHNLTRSILFREKDVGSPKAEVAARACELIDPNIKLSFSTTDFWESLSLSEIANADAIFCCVDNFEARIQLNKLCILLGTDFYNTGIDSRYTSVELFSFSTHVDNACYECNLPLTAYSEIQKRYSCGWLKKISFEEKKIPTTAITSSLCGGIATSLFLNRTNEHKDSIDGSVRYFQDSIGLKSTLSILQRNEACPTCSNHDTIENLLSLKRKFLKSFEFKAMKKDEAKIILSEPVVLKGTCKSCDRVQEYFVSSRYLNDSITYCSICNSYSISIDIVEELILSEFQSIFQNHDVPCKYIIYQLNDNKILIELEN